MSQIQGVGIGKAKKFGDEFIRLSDKYVEKIILSLSDMTIKTIIKKSSNKVYMIQSLDKKLLYRWLYLTKGLSPDDVIKEIETIVESGTKLDLQYI